MRLRSLTLILVAVLTALASSVSHAKQTAPTSIPPLSASRTTPGLPARPQAVPIPPGRQVFYNIADIPWVESRPGIRQKTIPGETVTFSLYELDPQSMKGVPPSGGHHHTYELVFYGIEGTMDESVDGKAYPVGPMQGVMIPPDAHHALSKVVGPGKVIGLEFSTVRRQDLLPPKPAITYPARPKPKPVPPGHQVFADFNAIPWIERPGGAKYKMASGDSCNLTLWLLPASTFRGTDQPGHHHTVEQISYVLAGHAEMRVGDQVRTVGPGTLLMIPSDVDHLPMKAINNEDILLLDFQPIVRHDLMVPKQ